MKQASSNLSIKQYRFYLLFMLIACGGAFVWQFFFPQVSGELSRWETSVGWQREIALWNIGIIGAILFAFMKKNADYMKILTLQSTILCWVLGGNHFITLLQDFSTRYWIHLMGVVEVLLVGGVWGTILLCKSIKPPEKTVESV